MIDKICKSYMSDVKALLPLRGKKERKFIKKISDDIELFCEMENVESKEDLSTGYGSPKKTVNDYIEGLETAVIIKRIRTTKAVRRGIVVFLVIATIATAVFGFYMHHIHKLAEKMEEDLDGSYVKEVIEIYH